MTVLRRSRVLCCVLLAGIAAPVLAQAVAPAPPASVRSLDADTLARMVAPIRWDSFKVQPSGMDAWQCRAILLNAARYNLGWIERTFKTDTARDLYRMNNMGEHGIRPACSVVYSLATLLKTGAYDERATGVSRAEALRRTRMLIRGVAVSHQANGAAKGWGDQWQSAHWAALLGNGAWMLWDDLDPDTRGLAARVVEHEANRYANPDYKVPYWRTPDGTEVFKGDTKAEENAWNAMVLQVAVAMMPDHPNAPTWKRVGSELMVSAFSMKKDLDSPTVLDGKPLKDWLHGYNVRDDAAVINHGILHPDYTATPTLSLRTYFIQSLAKQSVPETADWNVPLIYRSFATHKWPSPPYQPPGGTIYIPGQADVYYPQGTDWSRYRYDIFYLFDTFASILGWDKGLPSTARDWMRLRAARLLAMQARHPDGHAWEPDEAKQAYPNDQMLAWQMSDAYLMLFLDANHAIRTKDDWLSSNP